MRMNKRLEIPGSLHVQCSSPNGVVCTIRSRSDDTFKATITGPLADQYAQLFKSAPDMLAALCKARDALADLNHSEEDEGHLLAEIDTAIAQAIGATP